MSDVTIIKTVADLNREYKRLRGEILVRHGHAVDAENVRLQHAVALYKKINGQWYQKTSVKSDMVNDIDFGIKCGEDAEYKLVALV